MCVCVWWLTQIKLKMNSEHTHIARNAYTMQHQCHCWQMWLNCQIGSIGYEFSFSSLLSISTYQFLEMNDFHGNFGKSFDFRHFHSAFKFSSFFRIQTINCPQAILKTMYISLEPKNLWRSLSIACIVLQIWKCQI